MGGIQTRSRRAQPAQNRDIVAVIERFGGGGEDGGVRGQGIIPFALQVALCPTSVLAPVILPTVCPTPGLCIRFPRCATVRTIASVSGPAACTGASAHSASPVVAAERTRARHDGASYLQNTQPVHPM